MNAETKAVVRKVLEDAGKAEDFFDLSDAERMTWMIETAYQLGRQIEKSRSRRPDLSHGQLRNRRKGEAGGSCR